MRGAVALSTGPPKDQSIKKMEKKKIQLLQPRTAVDREKAFKKHIREQTDD